MDSGLLAPSEFNTFVMYLVEEQEAGGRQGTCRDTCHCNCHNDCCHDSHDDGRYGYNDGQTGHSGFNSGNGHSGYNDGQSGHSGYNDGLSGPTGNSGYNDGNSGFYDAPRESGYRTTPAPEQDKIIYITTPRQGALIDIENSDSVQFNYSHGTTTGTTTPPTSLHLLLLAGRTTTNPPPLPPTTSRLLHRITTPGARVVLVCPAAPDCPSDWTPCQPGTSRARRGSTVW